MLLVEKACTGASIHAALFRSREGRIVQVREGKAGLTLEVVDVPAFCHFLSQNVSFQRQDGREVYPPRALVQDLLVRRDWALPLLLGVTRIPVLRPDGTVLLSEGYDPATKLIYDAGLEISPLPSHPGKSEVNAAREVLDELVCDFEFDSYASRTNWFALVMTPIVRAVGQVPVAVIDGNPQGLGEGLLVYAAAALLTGAPALKTPLPASNDEMRKILTAKLLKGHGFAVFDKVTRTVNFSSLDLLLTADFWKDRVLHTSGEVDLPNHLVVVLTGNNITLGTDTLRRAFLIRLHTDDPYPWLRKDFRRLPAPRLDSRKSGEADRRTADNHRRLVRSRSTSIFRLHGLVRGMGRGRRRDP